jgi:hypothetical protein
MWLLRLAWATIAYCLDPDDEELRRRQLEGLDHLDRVIEKRREDGK